MFADLLCLSVLMDFFSSRSFGSRGYSLFLITVFCALSGLMMGFDLSIVATIINIIRNDLAKCSANVVCSKQDLFVGIVSCGAIIGCLSSGFIADVLGRRKSFFLSCISFISSSLIFFFFSSYNILLLARVLMGVGIGVGYVVFYAYISEITPTRTRGRYLTVMEVSQCFGVIIAFSISPLITSENWRLIIALPGVLAFLQIPIIFFIPESPHWLILKNRSEEASIILEKLNLNPDEINKPEDSVIDFNFSKSISQLLFANRTKILCACLLGIIQNALFCNAIQYNLMFLMEYGYICYPFVMGISISVVKLLCAISVAFSVDYLGRKALLMIGTSMICLAAIVLSVVYTSLNDRSIPPNIESCLVPFTVQANKLTEAKPYAATYLVYFLGLLIWGWECSWASLTYVVAAEILPTNVRGIGLGLVSLFFWLSLFLSEMVFQPVMLNFGSNVIFIYISIFSFLTVIALKKFLPKHTDDRLELVDLVTIPNQNEKYPTDEYQPIE